MNTKKFITLLCILSPVTTASQSVLDDWYFGENGRLTFYKDSVVAGSQPYTFEENSNVVLDNENKVIISSNGEFIASVKNLVEIPGNISSSQGTAIIPHPNDKSSYFVFISSYAYSKNPKIKQKILTINPDTSISIRDTLIIEEFNTSEKIMAFKHANGIDYWIITTDIQAHSIRPYLITKNGVIKGVESSLARQFNEIFSVSGEMEISPNGKYIAISMRGDSYPSPTILANFDNYTGKISNQKIISHTSSLSYGVEFSPNSNYLFISHGVSAQNHRGELVQYDVQKIMNNDPSGQRVIYSSSEWLGSLRTGVDGNIYLAVRDQPYIHTISNPNKFPSSFLERKINLISTTKSMLGLPNNRPSFKPLESNTNLKFTTICNTDSIEIEIISSEMQPYTVILHSDGNWKSFRQVDASKKIRIPKPNNNDFISIMPYYGRVITPQHQTRWNDSLVLQYSSSSENYTILGSAQEQDEIYTITSSQFEQAGGVELMEFEQLPDKLSLSFDVEFSNPTYKYDQPTGMGADGFAVVFTNQDRLGSSGKGIGYSSLQSSIAVEFDTFTNPDRLDPDSNHLALQIPDEDGYLSSVHSPSNTLFITELLSNVYANPVGKVSFLLEYERPNLNLTLTTDSQIINESIPIELQQFIKNDIPAKILLTGATGNVTQTTKISNISLCFTPNNTTSIESPEKAEESKFYFAETTKKLFFKYFNDVSAISIYTVYGQEVKTQGVNLGKQDMDLSYLLPGAYVARLVTQSGEIFTTKFIVP